MPIPLAWPTSGLDTLPKPGSATYTDDPGYFLDELCTAFSTLLEGMEAALGYAPTANDAVDTLRFLTASGSKGIALPITQLAPNILVNGNFDVWQQGVGVVTHPTTYNVITSYLPDQWFCLPAGATCTSTRANWSGPDTKSRYVWQIVTTSSVTTVDLAQRLRTQVVIPRCRQSLVFSCYLYQDSGSPITPNLRIGTPGAVDTFTTVTNRLDQALQSVPSATWTRVHAVFNPAAYTNIANGMEVAIRLPSSAVARNAYIAQCDLRPGTQFMAFVPPDPEIELRRALLYYEVLGGAAVFEAIAPGLSFSTTQANLVVEHSPKWTIPTMSVSAVGDFAVVNGAGTGIACNNLSFASGGPSRQFCTAQVAAGLTLGQATYMQANNTAAARLHISARL